MIEITCVLTQYDLVGYGERIGFFANAVEALAFAAFVSIMDDIPLSRFVVSDF